MAQPLKKLMLTTIETIIEGVEKEPWTAFINNTFDFASIVFNYKELVEQIKAAKENPQILAELKQEASNKWGKKYENTLISRIFDLVWAAILYKVATIIEVDKLVREFKK